MREQKIEVSALKRVFLIPNAITAFGLTCGLFVIFKMSFADPSRDLFSLLQASAILLLIAAVADLADGAVARLIRAESEFGGQFDSLSDSVTFGVAPPLLILKSLTGGEVGRLLTLFVIIAAMIYTLCGVLRLVRYNVKTKEVKESGDEEAKKKRKNTLQGSLSQQPQPLLFRPPLFWSLPKCKHGSPGMPEHGLLS